MTVRNGSGPLGELEQKGVLANHPAVYEAAETLRAAAARRGRLRAARDELRRPLPLRRRLRWALYHLVKP